MKQEQLKSIIKAQKIILRRLEAMLIDNPVRTKEFICPANDIIDTVNQVFETECRTQNRKKSVVYARHCAAYLLRIHTTLSLHEIAAHFGNICHTTSYSSIGVCQDLMQTDYDYAEKVNKVKNILASKYN